MRISFLGVSKALAATQTFPLAFKGPKGDRGADGTSINIKGQFTDPTLLPVSGINGDAYLISGEIWVWVDVEWINAGNIQGPKGDKGDTGDRGIQGIKGDTGDRGQAASFVVFTNETAYNSYVPQSNETAVLNG